MSRAGAHTRNKYDSVRDFAPVGFTAHAPAVIVARKDFPANDLREFVEYVKKNGDQVKQAHGGIGASSHMACLLFNTAAGTKPTLVAYRGTGPAMNDLVGGHVDFFCEQAVSVAPQISGGAIKAYAMSGSERLAALPDTDRTGSGVDYQMSIWAGIFAPRARPRRSSASSPPRLTRRWTIAPSKNASPISADRFRPSRTASRPSSRPSSRPRSRAGLPFSSPQANAN